MGRRWCLLPHRQPFHQTSLRVGSLVVESKLSNPDARINDIDFVVRKTGNRFQILDVRFEGISLLDSYRSEEPLMNHSGPDVRY